MEKLHSCTKPSISNMILIMSSNMQWKPPTYTNTWIKITASLHENPLINSTYNHRVTYSNSSCRVGDHHWVYKTSTLLLSLCNSFEDRVPADASLVDPCWKTRLGTWIVVPKIMAGHIDGFVQDCSNSIANALELLQSCTKPSTRPITNMRNMWEGSRIRLMQAS